MRRSEAYRRFERIRDELECARSALTILLRDWHVHGTSLATSRGRNLTVTDFRRCLSNLELTYIVRLFAAFEGTLRDYWLRGVGRKTEPGMKLLMEGIASRRRMDRTTLDNAHLIREFRNDIMHESVQSIRFDFAATASVLGAYLSWLPVEW